jgi:hypothetical protein
MRKPIWFCQPFHADLIGRSNFLAPLRLLCRRFGPDADEIFVLSRQLLHTPHHDLMGRSEDLLQRSLLPLKACYITLGRQGWQYPFDAVNFGFEPGDIILGG